MAKEIRHGSKFDNISNPVTKEDVSALCRAIWIRSLEHISYRATSDSSVPHLLDDFRSLADFIGRMPAPALKTLHLKFSILSDTNTLERSCYHHWTSFGVQDRFFEALTGLLDAASSKGCESFHIEGVYAPRFIRLRACEWQMPGTIPSILRAPLLWVKGKKPKITKQPLQESCKLRKFVIASAIVLHPRTIDHTLEVLQWHRLTLQHLEIASDNLEWVDPSKQWNPFFRSVHLPHLESFTCNGRRTFVRRDALNDFLSRHPTIISLYLGPLALVVGQVSIGIETLQLPNLRELQCHHEILPWILSIGRGGYPQLRLVRLVSPESRLSTFVTALPAFNTLPQPLPILDIDMDFSAVDCMFWVSRQVGEGQGSLTAQMDLTELIIRHPVGSFMQPEKLNNLVQWLSLFPNLEHLELRSGPFQREDFNEALCRRIVEACKRLKSFQFCHKWVLGGSGC